jgi:hypothetical protein|tara:strand:- start:8111 stop:8503 length:393 start_codon:yes stop_codon:yes gene_type:complete
MTIDTNVMVMKEDLGKNLYRKKTYYTLCIEQDVLADNKEAAENKLGDNGIDHSQINHEITEQKDGVETYMVDANYSESGDIEYVGKVSYTDDEYAEENGDVEVNSMADEVYIPDEVDTMININAEEMRGK